MTREQMQQIIQQAERRAGRARRVQPSTGRSNARNRTKQTLNTSRQISNLVDLLDGPASGAIRALVEKENQDKLLRALRQVSKSTASPTPRMSPEISKRMAQKAKPASEIGSNPAKNISEETIEELVSMLIESGIDSYM